MNGTIENEPGKYSASYLGDGSRILVIRAPGVSRAGSMPKTEGIIRNGWIAVALDELNGHCVEVYERHAPQRIAA